MQVRRVAQTMELAHQRGMIHRDLKPGNIMLFRPDPNRKTIEPKIMDFGLAKRSDSQGEALTKTGEILGTPCYMSKEQWSARETELGPSVDIYSLGVILYELLTGKLPFAVHREEPPTTWFVRLVTDKPTKPSQHKPEIHPALEQIVMKAIAVEAENRYSSMADLAAALEDWLKGKPADEKAESEFPLSVLNLAVIPKAATFVCKRKPNNRLLVTAACGAIAVILLGLIIKIKSPDGPTTTVRTDGKAMEVTTPSGDVVSVSTDDSTASTKESGNGNTAQSLPGSTSFPETPKTGSTWIGTYTVTNPNTAVPQPATATITNSDSNRFNVQVTASKGSWNYECEREGDHFRISNATLLQIVTDVPTGEVLIDSSKVELSADSLNIMLSRPVSDGSRQVNYRFTQDAIAHANIATTPGGTKEVPSDAVAFKKHHYKFFAESLSWTAAKQRCEAMGGRLPIVESAAENDFLVQMANKGFPKAGRTGMEAIWLGMTDSAKEGSWQWIDESSLTYSNWFKNQPNNKQNNEDFGILWLSDGKSHPVGQWCDQPDTSAQHSLAFICEWDEPAIQTNAGDPVRTNSIWVGDKGEILTILERRGESFVGNVKIGRNLERIVTGEIRNGTLSWLAKDVRAIKGLAGGDNKGSIAADAAGFKIDFVWNDDRGNSGSFTLRLSNPK